jgi:hypothetical protein
MAFRINDPEAERERLQRVQRTKGPRLSEELLAIAKRCSDLPVLDPRSPEEIIGYDERRVVLRR